MSSFESIPWCATLLREPGVVTFTPMARLPADADGRFPSQDQLFKTTLKTTNTVPEYLGFYKSPFSDAANLTLPPTSSAGPGPQFLINTVSLLTDLRPGVSGFNGTTHGGFIASLLDEAMGCLIFNNNKLQQEMRARGAKIPDTVVDLSKGPILTASMNVEFKKPLATPQVVIATATLNRIDGRKLYLNYAIKNGNGKEFARGEGVWVSARKERL
ncbi:HotDog domain-containing protein [Xylariaceae sp. AK1471]|nr:HotDog domain-containing protein [Xylariaceae sp. AK1471]